MSLFHSTLDRECGAYRIASYWPASFPPLPFCKQTLSCGRPVAMWPPWVNHRARSQAGPVNVLPWTVHSEWTIFPQTEAAGRWSPWPAFLQEETPAGSHVPSSSQLRESPWGLRNAVTARARQSVLGWEGRLSEPPWVLQLFLQLGNHPTVPPTRTKGPMNTRCVSWV